MVLQAVDPRRLHCAWWISSGFMDALRDLGGGRVPSLSVRLVEADRGGDGFREIALEEPPSSAREVEGSRFVPVEGPGRVVRAELLVDDSGRRVAVARSNVVQVPGPRAVPRSRAPSTRRSIPRPHVPPREEAAPAAELVPADAALASSREDEEEPGRLEAAPAGARDAWTARADEPPRPPEPVGAQPEIVPERAEARPPPRVDELPAAPSSNLETRSRASSPRIEIAADLVIYGSARPGTEVVIDGEVIPVAADGTFSLRLALPGGKVEPSSGGERKPGV